MPGFVLITAQRMLQPLPMRYREMASRSFCRSSGEVQGWPNCRIGQSCFFPKLTFSEDERIKSNRKGFSVFTGSQIRIHLACSHVSASCAWNSAFYTATIPSGMCILSCLWLRPSMVVHMTRVRVALSSGGGFDQCAISSVVCPTRRCLLLS